MDILDIEPALPRTLSNFNQRLDYKLTRDLVLAPGEPLFIDTTGQPLVFHENRITLHDSESKLLIPKRFEPLKNILLHELSTYICTWEDINEDREPTELWRHGRIGRSSEFPVCEGLICRQARTRERMSAPSYRSKHATGPRPKQYQHTEPILYFYEVLGYERWCWKNSQTKIMRTTDGKLVEVLDITDHEYEMRELFNIGKRDEELMRRNIIG